MNAYEQTQIWQKALGPRVEDENKTKARERLRVEFEKFRDRAKIIAGLIVKDLPDFTVHDITHIDALWGMADMITGGDYYLTPPEVFVLGGAFLIHDLGMGLAAYPQGIEQVKKHSSWADSVTYYYKTILDRKPTADHIENPDEQVKKLAVGNILRMLHAQHAEKLALIKWKKQGEDSSYFQLIEDDYLRDAYGHIIGLIAHSHWWDIDLLTQKLTTVGSIPDFPVDWTVDSVKLACILRIADAMHISDQRAPAFLNALLRPNADAQKHWNFQMKLYQPRLENDRIAYTSKSPFNISEAESWWLCYDTLKMIDRELKDVDSLLADLGKARLKAIGIASVEDTNRLSKLIQTQDWFPVDTKVKVTDVAKLAIKLGGYELYGNDLSVPIRELIQNGADAIRARRIVEGENEKYGDIIVRLLQDGDNKYIEIEDNGVGMSVKVLTGPFLDFGQSFWGTELMHQELPGLESNNFASTGKYGIGFFSVFMLGDKVTVYTRRYEDARENTWCLEFLHGLDSRPVLRRAEQNEHLRYGGTKIRVQITDEQINKIKAVTRREEWPLQDMLRRICNSVDVNVSYQEDNGCVERLITANDWLSIPMIELIKRLTGFKYYELLDEAEKRNLSMYAENASFVIDGGAIVGRCAIGAPRLPYPREVANISIGGLYGNRIDNFIVGILIGKSTKAARDQAKHIASVSAMQIWMEDQLSKISNLEIDDKDVGMPIAWSAWSLGILATNVPIAMYKDKWIKYDELKSVLLNWNIENEIVILNTFSSYQYAFKNGMIYCDNVVLIDRHSYYISASFDEVEQSIHKERPYGSALLSILIDILCEKYSVDYMRVAESICESNGQILIGHYQGATVFEEDYLKVDLKKLRDGQ